MEHQGLYPSGNTGTITSQPGEVLREGQGGRPPVWPHTVAKQNYLECNWTYVAKIVFYS